MGKNFRYFAVSALATVLSASIVTSAVARPDARKLSCRQVKKMIGSRGAVVFTTGRHTYERYVRNIRFCGYREITRHVSISTRDTRRCRVKLCEDASLNPLFDDDRWHGGWRGRW